MLGLGTGINKLSSAEASSIASRSGGYLLDTYSGAAAAYSLRQLSSSYSGNAVKVRRSSDNTETDIGFVGGELDTASLSSFAGAGDAFVVSWFDQSSNSNDATQTNTAKQPKIVSSGAVIVENGKPAVEFDGSDDALSLTSTTAANAVCQILVTVYDTSASSLKMPLGGTSFWQHYSSNRVRVRLSSGDLIYSTGLSNGTRYIGILNGTGSGYTIRQNGTQKLTSGSTANWAIDTIGRGLNNNTYAFDNIIQEVVLYESAQSAVNQAGIETNINTFYSIY